MKLSFCYLSVLFMLLAGMAQAQFGGFFEQMFSGGDSGRPQNVPSDSAGYRQEFEGSHCDKYLCSDTLACVDVPHHCPCGWPKNEDKFELADGHRICISKGGFAAGEAARKVELARKGML